jgi:hypothetical protein
MGDVFERPINREIDFSRAHFHCVAAFSTTKFNNGCSFEGAIFHAGAHFGRSCVFAQGASFREAEFHESAKFDGVVLSDYAYFFHTTFQPNYPHSFTNTKFAGVNFEGTRFLGMTTFTGCSFSSSSIDIVDCDLAGLRVLDARGAEGIEYKDVKWPRKRYLKYLKGRRIIADEISGAPPLPVLNYYRHLHKYYYDRSEFDVASDFYVSFMVTKRKALKGKHVTKLPDLVYSWFSRYGESMVRPLIALAAMWLLVPILLLSLGIQLDDSLAAPMTHRSLWDTDSSGTFTISYLQDYLKAFQVNFSLSTVFRSDSLRPALSSPQHTILLFETVLNALFIGFLAVGIRRSFAPKKPL